MLKYLQFLICASIYFLACQTSIAEIESKPHLRYNEQCVTFTDGIITETQILILGFTEREVSIDTRNQYISEQIAPLKLVSAYPIRPLLSYKIKCDETPAENRKLNILFETKSEDQRQNEYKQLLESQRARMETTERIVAATINAIEIDNWVQSFKDKHYTVGWILECRSSPFRPCNTRFLDAGRGAHILRLPDGAIYCSHKIIELSKNHWGQWMFMGRGRNSIAVAVHAGGSADPLGDRGWVELRVEVDVVPEQMPIEAYHVVCPDGPK